VATAMRSSAIGPGSRSVPAERMTTKDEPHMSTVKATAATAGQRRAVVGDEYGGALTVTEALPSSGAAAQGADREIMPPGPRGRAERRVPAPTAAGVRRRCTSFTRAPTPPRRLSAGCRTPSLRLEQAFDHRR